MGVLFRGQILPFLRQKFQYILDTVHTYIVYNARVHKITSLGHYSDDIRWLQVEPNVFKWPLVQMVHNVYG